MAVFNFNQALNSGGLSYQTPLQSPAPRRAVGPQSYVANVPRPISTPYGIAGPAGGQVAGITTNNPNTLPQVGGAGVGVGTGARTNVYNTADVSGVLEPTPQAPSGNEYDAQIQPALDALDQALAPLQSGYEADVAGINAQRQKSINTQNQNLAQTEASAQQATGRETKRTESAVDEARRQFSEIQQGLQSRYGGTTGTGKFAT